ncbi:hypothetical protein INR49_018375 [Caranx melampygus]|nr:hypothetical protein INR49_018375 [Caranx melampygus]
MDRGHAVAIIIFLLGMGTLLPWNFFITASQYFNEKLASLSGAASNTSSHGATTDYNYDSWMALLSQLPLLLFTLLNSFLYQWVKERIRVAFSLLVIFFLFCLTAALVPLSMHSDTFFSITMATVWFINRQPLRGGRPLPASLQHSVHERSGSGRIFAAVAMLCSILSNADTKSAALGYFITPCVATLGTLLCYLLLPHLEFAHFYLNGGKAEEEKRSKKLLSSSEKKDLEAKGKLEESEERSSVFAVFKR